MAAVNDKRTLYVGGLEEQVDKAVLHAAFVPFGELTDVMIPVEQTTGVHRGFGFITFDLAEDAASAIDNMNDAELFGRVLKVNVSKPQRNTERSNKPVWADENFLRKEGETAPEAPAGDAK